MLKIPSKQSLTVFRKHQYSKSGSMKTIHICLILSCFLLPTSCIDHGSNGTTQMPDQFVSIGDLDPTIQLDIRYFTSNNFTGRKINGYNSAKCILTIAAAKALVEAQKDAITHGYSIKVYDCYRPQRAVTDFVEWAKDMEDTKMQHRFYSTVPKNELFGKGYIAEKSGHSRGSTVDLTLVPLNTRQPGSVAANNHYDCRLQISDRSPDNSIDMGTGFDCFDELAHTDNPNINETGMQNRRLLRSMMENAGFVNYDKEWWHYTLRGEPFPDTYFDFPVQ
jgi:D-alanyl-D-alanine dipeptidase